MFTKDGLRKAVSLITPFDGFIDQCLILKCILENSNNILGSRKIMDSLFPSSGFRRKQCLLEGKEVLLQRFEIVRNTRKDMSLEVASYMTVF